MFYRIGSQVLGTFVLLCVTWLAPGCFENDGAKVSACKEFVETFNALECVADEFELSDDDACPATLDNADCDAEAYYECLGSAFACDSGRLVAPRVYTDCVPPCGLVVVTDGETVSSFQSVPPKAPDRAETDIVQRSAAQVGSSGPPQKQTSLDLCSGSFPTGHVFEVRMTLAGEVPESDPDWIYQYGFVFDLDNIAENNYRAPAEFPNDFFDDTDRWYVAEYDPSTGWNLAVSDATNGTVVGINSGACISIRGDELILRVPIDEMVAPWPRYRVTAFAHQGDFGFEPPYVWSGDVQPPVSEGLAASPGG